MLWAAWADAVGFISELTDESGLRHRTHGNELDGTLDWRRRIGGKYGVHADLPAGTYSDDTQLRLATARCISSSGFDVEAFARIELPVWPAYALGGGRASRAAATSMTKANATWYANFYDGWTTAGGNGAAMRIQPHVWADGFHDTYISAVIRDATVTHGHPRALLGAVLHAIALSYSLRESTTPTPRTWIDLLAAARRAVRFFRQDTDLWTIWVPAWEHHEQRSFDDAWNQAADECDALLDIAGRFVAHTPPTSDTYQTLVDQMGLRDPKTLGSGTGTVIAALALAAAFPTDPRAATLLAAHTLGTDTDTIATMAAALIAAAHPQPLPSPVQDEVYLRATAARLAAVALGEHVRPFAHPDILRWKPPTSQLDTVGLADGTPAISGLGWIDHTRQVYPSRDSVWSWVHSSFGASFLIKHRNELRELPTGNWPIPQTELSDAASRPVAAQPVPLDLFPVSTVIPDADSDEDVRHTGVTDDLDEIRSLRRDARDDDTLGRLVREAALRGNRDELALLIGAIWSHYSAP
ncbi:ADP-ribosylglycohydrolase family protein [Microbacterium sp. NRRL B-14842]|uniref:ADP-ribosylglycohydrolase family protein n=1 Tax=Microbacterium sp. NRRL B-14842 TaxID=3162881 RepID=UPI0035152B1C